MKVLVINAGSSSLKYQLMDPETGKVFAKGLCERIGLDGKFTYKPQVEGKETIKAADVAMPTHSSGGSSERRHLLHEGDRCGGSPCGPRRRDLRLLRAHQR